MLILADDSMASIKTSIVSSSGDDAHEERRGTKQIEKTNAEQALRVQMTGEDFFIRSRAHRSETLISPRDRLLNGGNFCLRGVGEQSGQSEGMFPLFGFRLPRDLARCGVFPGEFIESSAINDEVVFV